MDLSSIAATLRVLGDETRLRLLHVLWRGQHRPWSVGELVELLGLPQPTVSRHLAALRKEGMVECSHVGTFRHYRLADVQPRLHAAILGALEAFVPETPEARIDAQKSSLTSSSEHATNWLQIAARSRGSDADTAMSHVFKALGHPTRRRILDRIGAEQGCTLGEVAAGFDTSRAAIGKHIAVLETAGLVHSRREGRERRLFADAVPVQLIYDRWTTRFTAPLAAHVADIKYSAEARRHDDDQR